MKRSERWRKMKVSGKSEEEMFQVFEKEVPMTIFSWKGGN
jgi:penicillin-binding protein 1A